MTYSEVIAKKAKRYVRFSGALCLPSIAAVLVTFFGARTGISNAFIIWCSAYWWILFVYSVLVVFVFNFITAFLLRCPICNWRFSRGGISRFTLAFDPSAIKFCPHCGGSYDRSASV